VRLVVLDVDQVNGEADQVAWRTAGRGQCGEHIGQGLLELRHDAARHDGAIRARADLAGQEHHPVRRHRYGVGEARGRAEFGGIDPLGGHDRTVTSRF